MEQASEHINVHIASWWGEQLSGSYWLKFATCSPIHHSGQQAELI